MAFTIQVKKDHYFSWRYFTRDRWMNYWYQLEAVVRMKPTSVLEVGVGNKVVGDALTKLGISHTTVDIDAELEPDAVASVTHMPFPDASFDLVLAAEVLEHLPWDQVSQALGEIRRVTRRFAVVTLPHSGYTFALMWKIPLIPWQRWFWKLPHFWKMHQFNGEHYWEPGKKGYSTSRIKKLFKQSGFILRETKRFPDDPAHIHFVVEKI